ncbi:hypothetical protein ACU8KH_03452 [Lachancea thermotolerans]
MKIKFFNTISVEGQISCGLKSQPNQFFNPNFNQNSREYRCIYRHLNLKLPDIVVHHNVCALQPDNAFCDDLITCLCDLPIFSWATIFFEVGAQGRNFNSHDQS